MKAASMGKSATDGSVDPPGALTSEEVAGIGVLLIKHLRVITPLTSDGETDHARSVEEPQCAIDDVFDISEMFIKALQHLLPRLPPPNGEPSVASPPPSDFSLNAASELLVFSTYLRLIETYARILQHLQAHCQQGEDAPQGGLKLKISGWSIGSFNLVSQLRAQVVFTVHVIENMLT
ncbi:hypothetical protein JX265_007917 [Neoarthrinium moseri]|uniref:Uncharacterized protein n=1 Tax=Neoarthrinium moseri TaxID=1658444 RepID=A0A9P9WIU7_9PEZI|nr:hypothetical protein JX266_012477 [Neoarthrinium moseri]KAI1865594.1 hypothetical protein JX265_007917 [Neoarthrinium moseri]